MTMKFEIDMGMVTLQGFGTPEAQLIKEKLSTKPCDKIAVVELFYKFL